MTEELKQISRKLSKILKKDRYNHTLGVMYTAASLAMCYGADIRKAMTAGLLHDCGKYLSAEEQIRLCRKKNISLTESELEMPALVHAKLGAYLARYEYGITDPDILDAITYHTTGRPDASSRRGATTPVRNAINACRRRYSLAELTWYDAHGIRR